MPGGSPAVGGEILRLSASRRLSWVAQSVAGHLFWAFPPSTDRSDLPPLRASSDVEAPPSPLSRVSAPRISMAHPTKSTRSTAPSNTFAWIFVSLFGSRWSSRGLRRTSPGIHGSAMPVREMPTAVVNPCLILSPPRLPRILLQPKTSPIVLD